MNQLLMPTRQFAGNRPNNDALRVAILACLSVGVFLLASLVYAQPPKALIAGPKEAHAGDLVILDAGESVGTSRLWLLAASPVPKSFLPVDSGLRCVFATGTPGRYVFVLVVAGTGANGNALAEMATHEVVVTGGTVVPPVPPPIDPKPPDPTIPPTTSGVTFLVIVRDNQMVTADQAAVLTKLRTWSDARPGEITHLEISPDASSADDRLAGYVSRAGPLPWLIISRAKTDGSGAAVLWEGELPRSADDVTRKVAEVVK